MKYIILGAGNELSYYTWLDAMERSDVIYYKEMYEFKGLKRLLYKIHLSPRINKLISLPFKKIWWKYNVINNLKLNEETYILLGDVAFGKCDLNYLNMIKSKYKLKVLVVLLNPISTISKNLKEKIDQMDFIVTSDLQDSTSFNYPYITTVYSKIPLDPKNKVNFDLFFVGANKKRLSILMNCFETFKKNNIKSLFYIFDVKKNLQKHKDEIKYNTYLNYRDILQKVSKSNCIFEVIQNNQTGITYRTMEAICYNKKLLTNNENIKNFKYYNPDYIKIFKNIDDIDFSFIKEKISVNYGYADDFSPKNIIKYIEETESNK